MDTFTINGHVVTGLNGTITTNTCYREKCIAYGRCDSLDQLREGTA